MLIARILLGVEETTDLSVPATVLDYDPVRHDLRDRWHEDPDIAERLEDQDAPRDGAKLH